MNDRVWLDVPFEQKEAAKAEGARWDREARSWYAPRPGMAALAQWTPLPELLPGEDRAWGQGLFGDLVPRSCWFTNVRSAVMSTKLHPMQGAVARTPTRSSSGGA
jgi:uncharacterized protein DUF5710